ncbi:MAG: hypothetical protein ACYSSI_02035 [Planctomycetota bacterium]|jgi:hypothetical protein
MTAKDWKELQKHFKDSYKYYSNISKEASLHPFYPHLYKAGEFLFNEVMSNKNLKFELGFGFEVEPVAEAYPEKITDPKIKLMAFISKTLSDKARKNFYFEYWICAIAKLGRERKIFISNSELLNIYLPSSMPNLLKVDWSQLLYNEKMWSQFNQGNKDFLIEICTGSIALCNKVIETLKKANKSIKPPKGHIGSKEIKEKYGISPSTLKSWVKRTLENNKDMTVKDICWQTSAWGRQKYYCKKWLEKMLKSYKPRPRKSNS